MLADYSIRFNENLNANTSKRQKSQATVRTIWLIVLALLSTPITIPALIAILAVFALAVTVFAFVTQRCHLNWRDYPRICHANSRHRYLRPVAMGRTILPR